MNRNRWAIAASVVVAVGSVPLVASMLAETHSERIAYSDPGGFGGPEIGASGNTIGQASTIMKPSSALSGALPAPAPQTRSIQGGMAPSPEMGKELARADAKRIAAAEARSMAPSAGVAMPAMPSIQHDQLRIAQPEGTAFPGEPQGRDRFTGREESPYRSVREQPVSTFSLDVDTASYAFVRASLARNALPPKASVRTEEMVNYFPYAYPAPDDPKEPFKATVSVFPSPWNEGRRIVHVGIKGYEFRPQERPKANLVFLVDTSGSMGPANRLPLVKQALSMLVGQLGAEDTVAIVAYSGSAGTVLEPTKGSDKTRILAAIERLGAGGGTAGAEGIRQAYALAEANYDPKAVNRVMLATDGDFNVGITDRDELKGFVERKRDTGIFLSVLGFGMGNYNDATMQALAQNGNGVAAYIDTLAEARKTLVEEATSSIVPIARDVKVQFEFNPAQVSEYRLVGYESRALRREDFNNDKVDAGDVGSGHSVTAIYEIVPAGGRTVNPDLRYGKSTQAAETTAKGDELGFLSLRYKLPGEEASRLMSVPVPMGGVERFDDASQEARFGVSVAGFAEMLRGGRHTGRLTYDDVIREASKAKGEDAFGYRSDFVQLVRAAKTAAALTSPNR